MPARIARLERDARGYPIPWNVLRADDGTPFFTVNDDRKAQQALRQDLCPLCGETLGRWRWFVGGPRSAFDAHGWYLDLPGHKECMEFALAVCPYLAMPKYLGRIDVTHADKLPPEARVLLDETVIADRPEVMVMTCGPGMETQDRGVLQPYLRPGRPLTDWACWRHGARISEPEALPWLRAALGDAWTPPAKAVAP